MSEERRPAPTVAEPVADEPAPLTADEAAEARQIVDRLRFHIGRTLVGQRPFVDGLLVGLLADGHVLIEGLPGVAKSTTVERLATALDLEFRRIQFTPDLLPSDLIGSETYRPQTGTFEIHRGPIFSQVVLADEVNRAPAKVQSALLEAMAERHVSIAGQTLPLPVPFFVMATQNPIEQEGTYELPQAQNDRFLLKLRVPYPDAQVERALLDRAIDAPAVSRSAGPGSSDGARSVMPAAVTSAAEITLMMSTTRRVRVSPALRDYITALVMATRHPDPIDLELARLIGVGVSPRGTIGLAAAARAYAIIEGRHYATADDVRAVAPAVLRHRLTLSYEADIDRVNSDAVIALLLDSVPVP